MTSHSSELRSPQYGTTTFTSLSPSESQPSPSRLSYASHSDSQRRSSDGDDASSVENMRRITVSPSQSHRNSDADAYTDDNSLEEVEATLNDLDNDLDETEDVLTHWSRSSSSGPPPTYSSTGSGSGAYTGSTSYVSIPTFTPLQNPTHPSDPRIRLSRITERTEDSRPGSSAFSPAGVARPANPTPDALLRPRSAFLSTASPSHSRSSTDSGLPPPGRAIELIAQFETTGHTRTTSLPGPRSPAPVMALSQSTPNLPSSTGYGYGSSYGYGSRPSSPTKSKTPSVSSASSTGTGTRATPTMSTLLSPPPRSRSARPSSPGDSDTRTGTGSHLSPSTFTNTFTNTFTDTPTNTLTTTNTRTGTGTHTPPSTLRRPQTSPRSPLASVRNIVALWKERTPSSGRSTDKSTPPGSATSASPPGEGEGLFAIRRRAQRVGARLRETTQPTTPSREQGDGGDGGSTRSARSSGLPPGFDVAELSPYTQSSEAPLHIGLLWYLNVHAAPPYRWQRCQALLYPHMLLLSWLAPGGGRGIVALDLLNCTSVQSAPSPNHPSARDDVGTVAARLQSGERDGQPLMDMLVPFHMLYADGVERLAAESLLERQKWVNRLWEAVNRPVAPSVTRSPTGSIRTILSTSSSSSGISTGSRSTVFVPPLSSMPSISDFQSFTGSPSRSGKSSTSRRSSLVSSHHTRTVDDTVISNQEYVYPGDSRVITPSRGSSLRKSGSMTDLDEEFSSAVSRARGVRPGSGVTVSSGSSLGQDVFVTPPRSVGRGSEMSSRRGASGSDVSDEAFFSADTRSGASGSSGTRSNVSSFYSHTSFTSTTGGVRTSTGLRTDETALAIGSSGSSDTQSVPSTLSYRRTESASLLGDSVESGSYTSTSPSRAPLSRTREVRRRAGRVSSRSLSSSYQPSADESSDKENGNGSGSSPSSGSYTSGSGSYTPGSTGYDICPSSDLTDLTWRTSSGSTPPSSSSSSSEQSTERESEFFVTPSQSSSGYLTAKTLSSSASFESLPTIPSESSYGTADAGSTQYRTVSEPSSTYVTAEGLKEIPSERSTSRISSVRPESERDHDELKSAVGVPSVVPSMKSPSVVVQRLPQDIPLPPSVSSISSTPSPLESSVESSTSAPTPSSLDFTSSVSSSSVLSSIRSGPPSTPMVPSSTTSSLTESTLSSIRDLTPISVSSVSRSSLSPRPWASETNESYESSLLQASPSLRSLALHEGPDTSFETSFLRPSGSLLSSFDRLSTIPETSSPVTSVRGPFRPPSLPPSSLSFSLTPSSLVRTPSSVSTSSFQSQSSISSSVFDSRSLLGEPDLGPEPSTEPSLLSTPRPPSSHRVRSPTPLPSSPVFTPEGSIIVSLSTPRGDARSEQLSLTTQSSERTRSDGTITRGLNQLSDDLRRFDQARGLENQNLADNVRALRDELNDLSDFLRRSPPPIQRADQRVGASSILSSDIPGGLRDLMVPSSQLSRATSSASSVGSFLSSHHSDDFSLMGSDSIRRDSPPPWSLSSSERQSSPSSPPLPPSSSSPSSTSTTSTVRPPRPPDLLTPLNAIRDQLRALWDGQISTNHMLDELRDRPLPSDNAELADRLGRIEDLMRGLLDQTRPRDQPPIGDRRPVDVRAPADDRPLPGLPESLPSSEVDLDRYRDMLDGLYRGRTPPPIQMPVPTPAGPSLAQQLEDILSAGANIPPPVVQPPPALIPFVYQPAERGPRPRSASPASLRDLPRRPFTDPPVRIQPVDFRDRRGPRRTGYRPRDTSEAGASFATPVQPPVQQERRPDVRPAGPVMPQTFYDRPPSAPADMGGPGSGPGPSWYRPARPGTGVPPRQTQGVPPTYLPMPAGPTVVQLPPLFDSLMEILRENRLAQLATVDQQRELMRYMRGLNEWLERDVHDRQSELRGVVARVDQLRDDIRGVRTHDLAGRTQSTVSDESQPPFAVPGMPQPQPFFGPQFPPGFQPQGIQPFPPVIPPVVPGRTPPPGFPPVIPGAGGRIVIDQPPVIPMGGFGRPGGMQPSFPGGPDQTIPFIPPGASPTMGPMIRYEASPASSTSSSSSSSRRSRPSRRHERRDSRSSSGSRSPTPIVVQGPQVVHVPTQGISTIPSGPRAGSPGHPAVQPGPTIILQPQTQQPVPSMGPPGTFYPPTGSMIHPGAPGIVQVVRSRSSSPSSRRRRRSRSPERPPVIIQTGSRRSRSRSPRRRSRSRSRSRSPRRDPGVAILPSRGRSYSRSPRHEGMVVLPHPRSRSHSPIIVHDNGRVQTLPYMPPATTQAAAPIIVQPDGGRRTPPIIMGRTHSRGSSRGHGVPVIIPPSAPAYPARSRSRSPHERPPVIIPSRYGDRSRSRSRSPRRHRHRRDYSRSYSPDSRESRSRRRRHRRERESRSRSRSPEYYSPRRRRDGRRRDSRERSLSPTRLQRHSPTLADVGDHHVVTVPTQRHRPLTTLSVDEPYAPHDADVMPGARRTPPHGRTATEHYAPTPSRYREGDEGGDGIPQTRRRTPEGVPIIPTHEADDGRIHPVHEADAGGIPTVRPADGGRIPTYRPADDGRIPTYRPSDDGRIPPVHEADAGGIPTVRPADGGRIPTYRPADGGTRPLEGPPIVESTVRPLPGRPFSPSMGSVMHVPPRHTTPFPGDLGYADADRERHERLGEVEMRLQNVADAAQEAEERREAEFRNNEEDRQRLFLDSEARREQEARERRDEIWQDLEHRLLTCPPPVQAADQPAAQPPEQVVSDGASIAESLRTAATQEAASRHASDILATIRDEREEFAREREAAAADRNRLLAELEADRIRITEERDARIRALEDELAAVRGELENEKQQRITEEAETRERERQENSERDEVVRNQLGDITNLVQDQRDACARKKELMDERWEEKQGRRQDKDFKLAELRDMIQKMQDDLEADRLKAEEAKNAAESKPGIEKVLEELARQNAEQRELLNSLSDSWRADCTRQHEETLNAVRATAQEQVPFNVQGYLDEFSKALASEVRMLLGEVGKLREERRALQHELGYLLCMKSKYGPGGEFEPDWKPPPGAPGGPPAEPPPPEPPMPPELPPPAKPAWRSVPQRGARKQKKKDAAPPPSTTPGPGPDPRRQVESWATWQPNPAMVPTPPSVEPTLLMPDRGSPGLFGPRSPRDSVYGHNHS